MCVYVYMCTTFAAGKLISIIINEEIYNQENGLKNKYCVSVDKIYNINRNTKKYTCNLKNHLCLHQGQDFKDIAFSVFVSQIWSMQTMQFCAWFLTSADLGEPLSLACK